MDDNTTPSTNPVPPTQSPPPNPAPVQSTTDTVAPVQSPTAAPAVAEPSQQSVPSSWPGAFGVFKFSKEAVKRNLVPIILFYLASVVLANIVSMFIKNEPINQTISFVISSLFTAAIVFVEISGVRGKRVELAEGFQVGLRYTLKTIGLLILLAVSYIVSFLLLIIPFFFVFPRLVLAPYFLVDKDLGIIEAYKASWEATKGNAGKVWGIVGASILMALLFITIVGIPVAIYLLLMYSAAFAVLYEFLNKSPAAAPGAAPITQSPATPAAPAAL